MQHLISEIESEIEILKNILTSDEKREERIKQVGDDLRGGRNVTDARFDQVYPPLIRKFSQTHWTPVEVAIRASELFAPGDQTRVLDVGSGCGKFCTVAALSGLGKYTGIEQRPHLLMAAQKAAEELGVNQASFISGNMADLDWSLFDAFYLFNPFYEHLNRAIRIDETVSLNKYKFARYVEIVQAKLKAAKEGTKVATYHGFGGVMPQGYRLVEKEPIMTSFLELWVKTN